MVPFAVREGTGCVYFLKPIQDSTNRVANGARSKKNVDGARFHG
jgi:hypothetical protein